jgi:hypothetical protein
LHRTTGFWAAEQAALAAELGTSENTVSVHRGQVMQKMRADSVAELVRMAERLGINPPAGEPSRTKVQ